MRQALKLNTNNILLHEDALKAFQFQEECTESQTFKRLDKQISTAKIRTKRENANHVWIHQQRRLNRDEATALRQLKASLEKLDFVDNVYEFDGSTTELKTTSEQELSEQCKRAAAEAREARQAVIDSFLLQEDMIPSKVQHKIDLLRKLCEDTATDDISNSMNNDLMEVEQELVERFTAIQSRHNQKLQGGDSRRLIVDDAVIVLKRQMKDTTNWALGRIDEIIASEMKRRQQSAVAQLKQATTGESKAELDILRENREKAAAVARKEKEQELLDKDAQTLKLRSIQDQERASSKAAITHWKDQRQQVALKQQMDAYRQKYEAELERLERMEANGMRVEHRERQRIQKMEESKRKQAEAARAEELRLEELSQLTASVPYYDKIVGVQSNIYGTTHCSENGAYQEDSRGLAAFQQGLLHSFSNEKCFSDRGFRLAHALHQAGASNTVAARAVVAKTIPREQAPWHQD